MASLRKQTLTAIRTLRYIATLEKNREKQRAACVMLHKPAQSASLDAKIASFEAILENNFIVKSARAYLACEDLDRKIATCKRDLQVHLHKASVALEADALDTWVLHLQLLAAQHKQLRAERAQQHALIDPAVQDAIATKPRRRRPGGGRPAGGKRAPADWAPILARHLPRAHYDPVTGTLMYAGAAQDPTRERVTPARIPRGVLIAALMGHVARAVQTDPMSWAWRTLRLVDRADGLPDVDTDGGNPALIPRATRRTRHQPLVGQSLPFVGEEHDLA